MVIVGMSHKMTSDSECTGHRTHNIIIFAQLVSFVSDVVIKIVILMTKVKN